MSERVFFYSSKISSTTELNEMLIMVGGGCVLPILFIRTFEAKS